MIHSPDGPLFNITTISNRLDTELGGPEQVGQFSVFECNQTLPILTLESSISTLRLSTVSDYLTFLGAILPSSNYGPVLDASLWAPNSTNIAHSFQPYEPTSLLQNYIVTNSSSFLIVNRSGETATQGEACGTPSRFAGVTCGPDNVTVRDPQKFSLADTSNLSTDFSSNSSLYVSALNATNHLQLIPNFFGPSVVSLNLTVLQTAPNNWVELQYKQANVTVQIQLFFVPSTHHYNLGLTALSEGLPYAWGDTPVNASMFRDGMDLVSWLNSSYLQVQVRDQNNPTVQSSLTLNVSRILTANPPDWRNLSNLPQPVKPFENYTIQLLSIGPSIGVGRFDVYSQPDVEYLVIENNSAPTLTYPASLSWDTNGDFQVVSNLGQTASTFYVVLGYAYTENWKLVVSSGAAGTIVGTPLDNVFSLHVPSPVGYLNFVIAFSASVDTGLYVSFAELTVLSIMIGTSLERRFRRRYAIHDCVT